MNPIANLIDKDTLIPDLLLAAPQARLVLDRYGLRGCGGPLGPVETLEFFAKAHDVPLKELLTEIETEIAPEPMAVYSKPLPLAEPERIEDTIYRPFFKAGIAVILTLGAVWGAYLLLRIGFSGSFTAIGYHEVNAHGHAQIFGWVGLFVMGFAYQAFPRFKHASLAFPRMAYATLIMMVTGLTVRSITEPLGLIHSAWWNIAVAASVLEIAAIALFVYNIAVTLARSHKSLAFYDYYITSALVWFFVQGVYETLLLVATTGAGSRENLLYWIATWQAPLREIQIHGFAMLMILGVSQRLFHHFYDLPAPNPKKSIVALIGINTALVGIVVGFVLMRTVSHAFASIWYSSILLMVGMVTMLVWDWKIFSCVRESDRNLKFMRTAYIWLFISLSMLVLLPVYQFVLLPAIAPQSSAVEMGFSHAYYGAIRHAITVGFISLMIVGVAAKVVPTLNGANMAALSALWAPFWLINIGCALRVVGQTLTDFSPVFFPIAGVSGLLEVTGLALWGAHLWAVMAGRAREKKHVEKNATHAALSLNGVITGDHRVGDVLDRYPALLEVFLAHGFHPLQNPVLRQTLARRVTIGKACRMTAVDTAALLQSLNREAARLRQTEITLPILNHATA